MAMFTVARLALRRSPAAAPIDALLGLGSGLRQDPSRRLLRGQLLPRLFASDAPAPGETPPKPNKDSLECKRRYEEKRQEMIVLLLDAVDRCEPAYKDRVSEKQRELKQVHQEYRAKNVDPHGATMSKTADGGKAYSLEKFIVTSASCIFLGVALSELEMKLTGKK